MGALKIRFGIVLLLFSLLNACTGDLIKTNFDLGEVNIFDFIKLDEYAKVQFPKVVTIRGVGDFEIIDDEYMMIPDLAPGKYKAVGRDDYGNVGFNFEVLAPTPKPKLLGQIAVPALFEALNLYRESELPSSCSFPQALVDSSIGNMLKIDAASNRDEVLNELVCKDASFTFHTARLPHVSYLEKSILCNGRLFDNTIGALQWLYSSERNYEKEMETWKRKILCIEQNRELFTRPDAYLDVLNKIFLCHFIEFNEFVIASANQPFWLNTFVSAEQDADTLYGDGFTEFMFEFRTINSWDDCGGRNFKSRRESLDEIRFYLSEEGLIDFNDCAFGLDCIADNRVVHKFINRSGLIVGALANGVEDTIIFKYNEFGNRLWHPIFYKDSLQGKLSFNYDGQIGGGYVEADYVTEFVHHRNNDFFQNYLLTAISEIEVQAFFSQTTKLKCAVTNLLGDSVVAVPVTWLLNNKVVNYNYSNRKGISSLLVDHNAPGTFVFTAAIGDWRNEPLNLGTTANVSFKITVE